MVKHENSATSAPRSSHAETRSECLYVRRERRRPMRRSDDPVIFSRPTEQVCRISRVSRCGKLKPRHPMDRRRVDLLIVKLFAEAKKVRHSEQVFPWRLV